MTRRWWPSLPLGLLVASGVLGGCAATDEDTTNATVCATVTRIAGTLVTQARAQPLDPRALGQTLGMVHDTLQVRDSDASDQMRGDALVLQINVDTAQSQLAAGTTPSADRLQEALDTFRSRECG